VAEGTVSVRSRKDGEKGAMSQGDFLSMIADEIATRAR
jgi:hypothetical protein